MNAAARMSARTALLPSQISLFALTAEEFLRRRRRCQARLFDSIFDTHVKPLGCECVGPAMRSWVEVFDWALERAPDVAILRDCACPPHSARCPFGHGRCRMHYHRVRGGGVAYFNGLRVRQ